MSSIVTIALVIVLSCASAAAQDLKVYDLHGLPVGGYAVYASTVSDYDGKSRSAATTVSWLKQQADGSVWIEFAHTEGNQTTAVKVLAAPDGRALKMAAARGKAAAGRSTTIPGKTTVLADRAGMQDQGSENVTTAAGVFSCRHFVQTSSRDERARKSDLTLVTTTEKQHDVWVSEGGSFSGLVKERTTAKITERTYLGDRLLPRESPVRERTETIELRRVAPAGAVGAVKE